jgi:tetratricopeptide (TPR) repeat protein
MKFLSTEHGRAMEEQQQATSYDMGHIFNTYSFLSNGRHIPEPSFRQGNDTQESSFAPMETVSEEVSVPTARPDIIAFLSTLDHDLRSQGKYEEALQYSRELLKANQKIFGPVLHASVAISLNTMGMILASLRNYEEALK